MGGRGRRWAVVRAAGMLLVVIAAGRVADDPGPRPTAAAVPVDVVGAQRTPPVRVPAEVGPGLSADVPEDVSRALPGTGPGGLGSGDVGCPASGTGSPDPRP